MVNHNSNIKGEGIVKELKKKIKRLLVNATIVLIYLGVISLVVSVLSR